MNKQPKRMTSKYDGHCDNCGRHVDAGEQILWLSRGVIHCSDCMDTDNTPVQDDAWASALAWDAGKAQPLQSSFDVQKTPVTVNASARTAKPSDDTVKSFYRDVQAKPAPKPQKPVVVDFTRTETGERPELDAQAQTVCDLLVTLINAVDRLADEQRHAVYCHALDFGKNSASESRGKLWRDFAAAL